MSQPHHAFTGTHSAAATRVMRELHAGRVGSKAELAEAAHCAKRSIDALFRVLRPLGLVHIAGWRRRVGKGAQTMALYAFGPGPDASKPRKSAGTFVDFGVSQAARDILAVIQKHGPARPDLIHHETPYCYEYVCKLLRELRRRGHVHVARYDRQGLQGGAYTPVYALGRGRDAKRPAARQDTAKRRRKERLVADHGPEVAGRILRSRRQGGAERIVLAGRVVYERRAA